MSAKDECAYNELRALWFGFRDARNWDRERPPDADIMGEEAGADGAAAGGGGNSATETVGGGGGLTNSFTPDGCWMELMGTLRKGAKGSL
jgi:hypothetical protein